MCVINVPCWTGTACMKRRQSSIELCQNTFLRHRFAAAYVLCDQLTFRIDIEEFFLPSKALNMIGGFSWHRLRNGQGEREREKKSKQLLQNIYDDASTVITMTWTSDFESMFKNSLVRSHGRTMHFNSCSDFLVRFDVFLVRFARFYWTNNEHPFTSHNYHSRSLSVGTHLNSSWALEWDVQILPRRLMCIPIALLFITSHFNTHKRLASDASYSLFLFFVFVFITHLFQSVLSNVWHFGQENVCMKQWSGIISFLNSRASRELLKVFTQS